LECSKKSNFFGTQKFSIFVETVEEYKEFKGLKKQSLRDHMNDLELIFTMLGEKVSTEITQAKDAQGFVKCKDAAARG
jgi:DNA-damage-inducible protein D